MQVVNEHNIWEIRFTHKHGIDTYLIESKLEPTKERLEDFLTAEAGYNPDDEIEPGLCEFYEVAKAVVCRL